MFLTGDFELVYCSFSFKPRPFEGKNGIMRLFVVFDNSQPLFDIDSAIHLLVFLTGGIEISIVPILSNFVIIFKQFYRDRVCIRFMIVSN